jgi:predicted nicotinamide N-methyase
MADPMSMLNFFETYETHEFEFPTSDEGAPLRQTCLSWRVPWSEVLPRLVAAHGAAICGGKTVIELGAGCGLVGLVAARFASHVDITDGDPEEVELIRSNVESHAPERVPVNARYLDWGASQVAEARASGVLRPAGYDVVLAAQVVYVPAAIGLLVETIAALLSDDPRSHALLYNDAVACTSTQAECRALLDAALPRCGLRAEPCVLRLPPGCVLPHADSYLLRVVRQ